MIPALKGIVALGPHKHRDSRKRADADYDSATKNIGRLMRVSYVGKVSDSKVQRAATDAALATSSQQKEELRKQANETFGVDPFIHEPWLASAVSANVRQSVELIKTIPETYFGRIEASVTRGVIAGKRAEEIAQDLKNHFLDAGADEFVKMEARAGLIARDQVNKFFGNLAKLRQEDLGVKAYIWRTSLDERVRPSHAAREGKRFSWDNPPEDGHPGQPINCRCVADPVLEELSTE